MELDIYIVSLKNSARRGLCEAIVNDPPPAPKNLSPHFAIFDAIDKHSAYFATDLPHSTLIQHSYAKEWLNESDWYQDIWGRELFPEELGCYASHYMLWLECIKQNKPLVVLEDDFDLQSNFYESLLDCLESPFDFVRLYGNFWKAQPEKAKIANLDGAQIVPTNPKTETLFKGHFMLSSYEVDSTSAYYLTPRAAKAFASFSLHFVEPVDQFLNRVHLHQIPSLTYIPLSVRFNPHHLTSSVFTPENSSLRESTYKKARLRRLSRLFVNKAHDWRRQRYYRRFLKRFQALDSL
ncbi:glycosyltransferase family 25 protein [Helicobacter ailurogastricus]|uniref:glycosyltransferase family 25 protein n=1 Tax=Helicobacter ailurogastricus TaxID=1578720 RepID=UPI000CF17555|nr:glycosyltransferase family 25 protein [Helicobacter ailurogastricus]